MKSIVITGCNRGLGLGMVKQLLKSATPPEKLLTTCRSLEKATELQDLAKANKNLHILELDVKQTDSFDVFAKQVETIVGQNGLNVLFNNAGSSSKFTRIRLVKLDQLVDGFAINTIGPIMLTKALYPLLKKAADTNPTASMGSKKAAVVNMSSILGSVANNTDGGFYPYRCSKAALNMATKSMSLDFKGDGILATCVHPGWVQTDMGGANAPMSVEESCGRLVKFVENLGEIHNGGYFQYDGEALPW